MNGARFVHDRLELAGWEVEIADALKVKGLAPLACKTAREASVAVSPGIGFGPDGDGFVRFALVENEHRIGQAVRGTRRLLSGDG